MLERQRDRTRDISLEILSCWRSIFGVGACLCPFTTAAAQCRARAPEPIPWVTPRFEPAVLSVKKLAVRTTSAVLSTWYQARAWRLWPSRWFRRTITPCRLSCSSATSNVLAPPAVGTTIQAWPRNRRQHRPRGGSDGAIMAPHDGMLPSPSMASSRPSRFNGGVPQPHRAKRAVAFAADVRGGRPRSVRYRRHCVVPVRSNLAGSTPDQSEWGTQLTCIAGWFDKYMMSGFLGDCPTCDYLTTATITPPKRPAPGSPEKTIREAKNRRGRPRRAGG